MQDKFENKLLYKDEGDAFAIGNAKGESSILLICEHASKAIPESLGDLGLDEKARNSHIAWDPGAFAVAAELGQILDATIISARFSRLVYDCNRPPDVAGAMPGKSEIYSIPGNQGLNDSEKKSRVDSIYEPFKQAVSQTIDARVSAGRPPVLLTIHSFTPVYHGQMREVELGILHDTDAVLADVMLGVAASSSELNARRNQPYGPEDGVTHTLRVHAVPNGLLNVMIEIRNDLIVTEKEQQDMARELADIVLASLNLLEDQTTKTESGNA